MIEKILLDYLSGALSVPVYLERPESPPTCYILLERVGGGRSNYIRSAAMAVAVYCGVPVPGGAAE